MNNFAMTYGGFDLDYDNGITVNKLSGTTGLDIRTSRSDLVGQDGGNVYLQRYGMRIITVEGIIAGLNSDSYFSRLDAFIEAFDRTDDGRELSITRWDTATTRKILNTKVLRTPQIVQQTGRVTFGTFQLQLISEDPFFSGESTLSTTIFLAQVAGYDLGPGGDFDFDDGGLVDGFDIEFLNSDTKSATNSGNAITYPTITIDAGGGITNPTLTNLDNSSAFTINRTLVMGDTVVVSRDNQGVSVVLNGSTNIFADFSGTLFPLEPGGNTLRFSAAGFDATANILVEWEDRFLSL
jgi:hypothetical protein